MRTFRSTIAALGATALGGALLLGLPTTAHAGTPNCSVGNFCAWQHINYDGHREMWSGDDRFWGNNDNINNQDSSWHNRGISGPGIPDHVRVYNGFYLTGGMTICVPPGSTISRRPGASDRGSSHTWAFSC